MDSKSLRFISHQSLFSTVRSGDLQTLKLLLDKLTQAETPVDRASISTLMTLQNDAGETALYVAAENNLQDIFGFLLNFCDLQTVMIRSKSDLNVFHAAAKLGHLEIVNELLSKWPELCKSCDSSNTSPIYSAAVRDHLDVVNAILDADVSSLRIVRKNGKTALHTAARYGFLRIVKALVERDPEIVYIKDKKGQTALHMAVKGRSLSVVEELLLADPSILNERDNKGNTAVHISTKKWRSQSHSIMCVTCTLMLAPSFHWPPRSIAGSTGLPWTESDINLPPSDLKRMNPSSSSSADINPQKKTHAGLSPSPEVLQYVASCVAPSPHLPTVSNMTNSSIIESMIPSLNSVDEGGLADTQSPCGKQKDSQSSPLELPAPLPVQRLEQTESRDSSKTQTDPPRTEQPDLEH